MRAAHIGDWLFYFACFDVTIFLLVTFMKHVPGRFSETVSAMVPTLK